MSSTSHQAGFLVPADHPALPGHFPGTPVVPGVVVLDHVLRAGEAWLGRPLGARGLKQVKFQSALLPDEPAEVSLEMNGESLAFRVTRAGQTIAQGTFVVIPADARAAAASGSPADAEMPCAGPAGAAPASSASAGATPASGSSSGPTK